jgi:hypothetical protein
MGGMELGGGEGHIRGGGVLLGCGGGEGTRKPEEMANEQQGNSEENTKKNSRSLTR